jgi:hypothetical protein
VILQRCKVAKTETADGRFKFPNMALGMELWILPTTTEMRRYRRVGIAEEFKCLSVMAKDQQLPIPVEILDYTSDFRVEGY